MIILNIDWETELRAAHGKRNLGMMNANDVQRIKDLKMSLNQRCKEINKMILAGTAVYEGTIA